MTEKSLGIFWEGEERAGLTIYGLFRDEKVEAPTVPLYLWPNGCECKSGKLSGEFWAVWLWDIRVDKWPKKTKWLNTLSRTLKTMIDQGATIAWAGLEGFFAEPPNLFHPDYMSGGIWAIYMDNGNFICNAKIGEPFKVLEDTVLKHLFEHYSGGILN